MERKVINTNIRLNLADEQDRRAWEYLQSMDRKKYKSYTRAVVAALNHYFEQEYRREEDPYLETREKEDAFLERVLEAVKEGAEQSMPMVMLRNLVELLQPIRHVSMDDSENNTGITYNGANHLSGSQERKMTAEYIEQEEAEDAALDFADSF